MKTTTRHMLIDTTFEKAHTIRPSYSMLTETRDSVFCDKKT